MLTPNRRRWLILLLIFAAVVLNYFDRQILSILKPLIRSSFSIDDTGYARLVNVFIICYAAMYPLAGYLVDRFGVARMLAVGIATWSAACIGAGLSTSLAAFTACRALLGLAEPIAFPAQLRAVTLWFPGSLRATANSACVAGGTFGAILAPPLVAFLTLRFNWHLSFILPGLLGLALVLLWLLLYRDPPPTLAASDSPPAPLQPAFTWPQLWRTRSLYALILIRLCSDPVWYFCLFWLPGYLQEHAGLSLAQTGKLAWIPFLAADLGGIATAAFSDHLVKRGSPPLRARKIMLASTAAFAPICALTPHFPSPYVTLLIFSVVGIICLSWLFTLSVVIAESFPQNNVGSVLGIAAAFGAAGSIPFNLFVAHLLQSLGSPLIFHTMALLHPIAALILCTQIRPEHPTPQVASSK